MQPATCRTVGNAPLQNNYFEKEGKKRDYWDQLKEKMCGENHLNV